MRSPQEQIETVRTMGEAMIKINNILHSSVSDVDFPEVDLTQADAPEDWREKAIELTDDNFDQTGVDGAEDWWNAWCEVRAILDTSFKGDVEGGNSVTLSEGEPNGNMRIKNEFVHLRVRMYNGIGVSYIAEYYLKESDTWVLLYEGEAPSGNFESKLIRDVIGVELAIIANATESAAETIDYWMTEGDHPSWSQSSWAEARGVGRQTVNDRVRSAVNIVED